jgi:hypothetical protein
MVITPVVVDAPEVLAEAEDIVELVTEVDEELDEVVIGEYGPALAAVALTLPLGVDGGKAGAPRTNGTIHNSDSSLDSMAVARVDFRWKNGQRSLG